MKKVNDLSALSPFLYGAMSVYTTGCGAQINRFADIFSTKKNITGLSISGIFIPGINALDYSSMGADFRCQTFFMTPALQAGFRAGRVDYCPWRHRDIIRHYQTAPADVAVVMLSHPNQSGRCSFGVTCDFSPLVLGKAKIKIGVINSAMPQTMGGCDVAIDELDAVVNIDQPMPLVDVPHQDAIGKAIASSVAAFIEDGATLQFGLGKIPSAIAGTLYDRRNLRVRSGLIDDAVIGLEAAGALSPDAPVIAGVGLGAADFYRAINENERFHFQPASVTHDARAIAATPNFIAINTALEVDLLGQVNSCVGPEGYLSGPGGLPEFVAGALQSPGGRSIVVLSATAENGHISRVVPRLASGIASVAATDADIVVTEFGCAELRGRSVDERAKAMIAIAAPEHREMLMRQWHETFRSRRIMEER